MTTRRATDLATFCSDIEGDVPSKPSPTYSPMISELSDRIMARYQAGIAAAYERMGG